MHEEIRQGHTPKQNKANLLQHKWRGNKTRKKEDSGASTQGSEHHQPVPSQYKGDGPTVKWIQRVWFGGRGKRGLYLVFSRDFFWEYTLLRWYLTQKR